MRFALVVSILVASAPAAADWQDVATGVRYDTFTRDNAAVYALEIDLCAPGVSMRATAPGEGPRTTGSFAELTGVFAAINGDWWAKDGSNPSLPQTTFPRGLAVGDGQHFPGTSDPNNYGFFAFGAESVVHSISEEAVGGPKPWMEQVVSGQPTLVWNGALRDNPAAHCGIKRARTAKGLSEDGSTLYWAVVQEVSGSVGMTCNQMAALMKSLGAHSALNQDGGGSSTMWIRGRGTVNKPSDGSPRSVVTHWGVRANGEGPPRSCPNRTIPSWIDGERRHVQSLEVMLAWGFSWADVAVVSDGVLEGWPEGKPWPATPTLIRGDGDLKVNLVDGGTRRHVTSPTSMSYWRFDWASIAPRPGDEVDAMADRGALPESPVLVKGSGDKIYLIDYLAPEQPDDDGDSDADPESPPDPETETDDVQPVGGCATAGPAPLTGFLLCAAMLLFTRRRRRL